LQQLRLLNDSYVGVSMAAVNFSETPLKSDRASHLRSSTANRCSESVMNIIVVAILPKQTPHQQEQFQAMSPSDSGGTLTISLFILPTRREVGL